MSYARYRQAFLELEMPTLHDGSVPLVPPTDMAVTYILPTVEEYEERLLSGGEQYVYASDGNPTTNRLERLFARLHNADEAIVTSSGAAAMAAALLGNLRQGSTAVVLLECYKSSRFFLERVLREYGVKVEVVSLHDSEKLFNLLDSGDAGLCVLESPTNPMTFLADLGEITRRARKNGVLTILDNTLAGPENHVDLDIDIFVYSLTKTLNGHGDALGGAVVGPRSLLAPLRNKMKYFSPFLDPHASQLILRGMRTYPLRMEYIHRSIAMLLSFLKEVKPMERVYYPGDPAHPHYSLFRTQMCTPGVVISFTLDMGAEQIKTFLNSLRIIKMGFSFGSIHSLISPALLFYGRELSKDLQQRSGLSIGTVRLSVGLEEPESLIDDLQQALKFAQR